MALKYGNLLHDKEFLKEIRAKIGLSDLLRLGRIKNGLW